MDCVDSELREASELLFGVRFFLVDGVELDLRDRIRTGAKCVTHWSTKILEQSRTPVRFTLYHIGKVRIESDEFEAPETAYYYTCSMLRPTHQHQAQHSPSPNP